MYLNCSASLGSIRSRLGKICTVLSENNPKMVEQLPYAADLGHVDFAKFGLKGRMLAGFLYDPVDLFLREITC